MMKILSAACLCVAMVIMCGCAPLSVHVLSSDDFTRYSAPRRIAVVAVNDTDAARRVSGELEHNFAAAGFDVVPRREVEGLLTARNISLRNTAAREDALTIGSAARLDAVVLVRQFYGTELRMVETPSGRTRASGCWRTSTVRIVNEMVDQIEKNAPASRWCPVPSK